MKTENKISKDRNKSERKELERKVYSQPEIIKFGSMQRITLLSSVIGTGDSGNAGTYFP